MPFWPVSDPEPSRTAGTILVPGYRLFRAYVRQAMKRYVTAILGDGSLFGRYPGRLCSILCWWVKSARCLSMCGLGRRRVLRAVVSTAACPISAWSLRFGRRVAAPDAARHPQSFALCRCSSMSDIFRTSMSSTDIMMSPPTRYSSPSCCMVWLDPYKTRPLGGTVLHHGYYEESPGVGQVKRVGQGWTDVRPRDTDPRGAHTRRRISGWVLFWPPSGTVWQSPRR